MDMGCSYLYRYRYIQRDPSSGSIIYTMGVLESRIQGFHLWDPSGGLGLPHLTISIPTGRAASDRIQMLTCEGPNDFAGLIHARFKKRLSSKGFGTPVEIIISAPY